VIVRWLEDLLDDGWWATGPAVRFQLPGQRESTIAYGELLRQAASLAARIGEPNESAQTRLAILTTGSAEGLIGLMAGLISGAVVISTPIQTSGPWSADLLGDPDVVATDATGGAVLRCHERLIGVKPDYRVLSIDLAEPAAAGNRPDVHADQDDVCKIAYLDPDRSPLVLALTGFALDAAVRQRDRWSRPSAPAAEAGPLQSLADQIAAYRTLAAGGVVDLVPRRPRPVRTAPVTAPAHAGSLLARIGDDMTYIVDDAAQIFDLLGEVARMPPPRPCLG
jgi:hypothetical protein